MAAEVFLSYARRANHASILSLRQSLASTTPALSAFFDEADLSYGESFPTRLSDAILSARIIVVALEPLYFTRWYCRLEYRLATALFAHDPTLAARHLVVALPDDPDVLSRLAPDLDELPPSIRDRHWPRLSDTAALSSFIRAQCGAISDSLGTSFDRVLGRATARELLTIPADLPPPLRLGPMPVIAPPRASLREGFVGRSEDLWRLHQSLAPGAQALGHAAVSTALRGMGGVGKTQLAAEYVYRYGPRHFTGGVFWIDAKHDVARQHQSILRQLGSDDTPDLIALQHSLGTARATEYLAERLSERLRQAQTNGPVLFVVDDVPEMAFTSSMRGDAQNGGSENVLDVTSSVMRPPGLERWCPAPDAAACLATSRAVVGFVSGAPLTSHLVTMLPREAAIALLTGGHLDWQGLSADDWGDVAQWVGCLPLALMLLHRALHPDTPALSPVAVLESAHSFAEAAPTLDMAQGVLAHMLPDAGLRGISAAFRLSYDVLPERAKVAACRFATLASASIPRELAAALGDECGDAGIVALLRARSFLTMADPSQRPSDIDTLDPRARRGDYASTPHTSIGRMHSLLAGFVRSITPKGVADDGIVISALASLAAWKDVHSPSSWALLEAAAPHARLALSRVLPSGADAPLSGDPSVAELAGRLGELAVAQGRYEEARHWSSAALNIRLVGLGTDHRDTLESLNNLAVTHMSLGDYAEARRCHERVVESCTRCLGPDHSATLTALNNFALTLHAQGELSHARDVLQMVVKARARHLGAEHPDALRSAANLAGTLHALGDLPQAREQHASVLEARMRVLGPEHLDTLRSLASLAVLHRAAGNLAEAQALQERVLAARKRILGASHPDSLLAVSNLAITLRAVGQLSLARTHQEEVLSELRRRLGDRHPATLRERAGLAETMRMQEDFDGARRHQEQIAFTYARLHGEASLQALRALVELAETLIAMGDRAGADVHVRSVYATSRGRIDLPQSLHAAIGRLRQDAGAHREPH